MKKSRFGMVLIVGLIVGIAAFVVYLSQWQAPLPEGTLEKPVAPDTVRPS